MNLLNGSKKNYSKIVQTIKDYEALRKPSIADDEAQSEYNKVSKKLSSTFKAECLVTPRDYRLHFALIDVAIGRILDHQGFKRDPVTGLHNPQVIQDVLDVIELEVEVGSILSQEDIDSLQAEDPNVDEEGNRQLQVVDAIPAEGEAEAPKAEEQPKKGKGKNKDDGSTAEAATDVTTRKLTEEEAVAS